MAKKKIEQETAPIKPMEEMSDSEFISYADYLSSPYYRAYITAKCRGEGEETVCATESRAQNADNKAEKSRKAKKQKKAKRAPALYVKKRAFPLVLIAILTAVVIAVGVLGFLNIDNISGYASIYSVPQKDGTTISVPLTDPIIGMIKSFVNLDTESYFFAEYMDGRLESMDVLTKISVYAIPVAALIIVLFAVIGFIKAIAALCAKRKSNGYYGKFKFGFLSVASFLSAVILFFGGLYVSGISLESALDFILFKSDTMQAGYGLYALVIIPIITFILTCTCYKKQK